jgi:hypothetical protein
MRKIEQASYGVLCRIIMELGIFHQGNYERLRGTTMVYRARKYSASTYGILIRVTMVYRAGELWIIEQVSFGM